jgi:histidine triad (HIT) family protein
VPTAPRWNNPDAANRPAPADTDEEPMASTVFSKILRKEIPADLVHEDELCIAFNDINPQAPTHILIIPRKEIQGINAMADEDAALVGHLFRVARDLARSRGLEEGGYRLVVNTGADAGQTVFHLHVHLLAGRTLTWPPG